MALYPPLSPIQTLSGVLTLKQNLENTINRNFGKRVANANILLSYLFKKPIVHVNQVCEILDVSYKTANDLVTDFVDQKILQEMTGQSRNRMFVLHEYVKLFSD